MAASFTLRCVCVYVGVASRCHGDRCSLVSVFCDPFSVLCSQFLLVCIVCCVFVWRVCAIVCLVFFVSGLGCSRISHHHHHHHHLPCSSRPWRWQGQVEFARHDCFCLVSLYLQRKETGRPPEVGCFEGWHAERTNRWTNKRLEAAQWRCKSS